MNVYLKNFSGWTFILIALPVWAQTDESVSVGYNESVNFGNNMIAFEDNELTVNVTPSRGKFDTQKTTANCLECQWEFGVLPIHKGHNRSYWIKFVSEPLDHGEIGFEETKVYEPFFHGAFVVEEGEQKGDQPEWDVTGKLVVSDYNFKIIVEPTDNFQGRSLSDLGVGETGVIRIETIPENASITTVQFTCSNTESLLLTGGNGNDPLRNFHATLHPGEVIIHVAIRFRNGKRMIRSKTVNICKPSGVLFEIFGKNTRKGSLLPLPANVYGASMKARANLLPKNVAFSNLLINEGTCEAVMSGIFLDVYPSPYEHPAWEFSEGVELGNIATGCGIGVRNGFYDDIGTLISESAYLNATHKSGNFLWEIPWRYEYGNVIMDEDISEEIFVGSYTFTNLSHTAKLRTTSDGVMVNVEKNGGKVSRTHPLPSF